MKVAAPCFALGVWIASALLGAQDPPASPATAQEPAPAGPVPGAASPSSPAENSGANAAPGAGSGAPDAPTRAAVDPVLPPDPKEAEADRIAAEAVAGAKGAAALTADEKLAVLKEALGANADEALAYQALDEDVVQLRETLEAMIGQGEDTQKSLEGVPGFDDDLERIGIAREIADEIRDLYPQVQSLRGKLMLLDAQTGTSGADFKPVQAASPEPDASGVDSRAVATPAPLGPRPRSAQPKVEATLCFHAGDVDGALQILTKLPAGELGPREVFVLGSCFVAKRRFAEARKALAPLIDDDRNPTLQEAARRQVSRMNLIEAGLVGLDPLVIAVEENKR